jgi:hypothetical protein
MKRKYLEMKFLFTEIHQSSEYKKTGLSANRGSEAQVHNMQSEMELFG